MSADNARSATRRQGPSSFSLGPIYRDLSVSQKSGIDRQTSELDPPKVPIPFETVHKPEDVRTHLVEQRSRNTAVGVT